MKSKRGISATMSKKSPNFGWVMIFVPIAIIITVTLFEALPWFKEHSELGAEAEANNLCSWGRAMMREGRYREAMLQYEAALKIKPDLVEALVSMGIMSNMIGDDAKALNFLKKAIELNPPKKGIINNNLGLIYEERGEFDLAVESYHKAAAFELRSEKIWRNIALVETQLGNWNGTIEAYLKAIENRPTLRNLYLEMLREELAEDYDKDVIDDLQNQLDRGVTDDDLKQFDASIANYFLMTNSSLAEDYTNLALAYERIDQLNEAITFFRKALTVKPGQVSIYNRIGILYAKQGLLDEAEEAFETCLKVDPKDPGARRGLDQLLPGLRREMEGKRNIDNQD